MRMMIWKCSCSPWWRRKAQDSDVRIAIHESKVSGWEMKELCIDGEFCLHTLFS